MSNSRELPFDLNSPYCHEELVSHKEENIAMPFPNHVHQVSSPPSLRGTLNVDQEEEVEIPSVDQIHNDDDNVIANTVIDSSNSGNVQHVRTNNRRENLHNDKRWAIYNALLARSVNGKLKRDTTTKEVSELFRVSRRTVQRIWRRAKDTLSDGNADVSHRKPKNCDRKRIQIGLNEITSIPLRHRKTLRSLGIALGVSPTTVHSRLKGGIIRRHSNAIKPLLRDGNKRARLQFCLDMLDPSSIPQEPKFVGMYNVVHIDEKWFYMTEKNATYYLHHSEEEPLRTCQSKNFIIKVMFLVAVARPRFDEDGNEVFSGKIGMFPFITRKPAQRSSRYRQAGTIEVKSLTIVTRDTVKAFLIEKFVPAIKEKWPAEDSRNTIFIQQDNAKTHIDPNDEDFRSAALRNGLDLRILCQPPNSPDLNVLDLGFFTAIQSLQHKECPRNIEELLHATEKSFNEYSSIKGNRVFVSLQLCMREIMRVEGSNKYKIPHINKAGLERDGCLPQQIACDYSLVQGAMNILA